MNKPVISIIAAISENRVIGRDNHLPWSIPEDLKRLKKITYGHPIVMGRKTYESMGKPLPHRTNIVITRDTSYKVESAVVVHSLEEGIAEAKQVDQEELFIFGGGEIFKQALPIVQRLYLTIVHVTIEGDAFFPEYSEFKEVTFQEDHLDNTPPFTFINLEK